MRDKTILLVGGCGGLGQASADLLRSEGAQVVVTYRSNKERAGDDAIQADITLAADRDRLLESVPYGLVIFAGIPSRGADENTMRASLETNYLGPILLARQAAEKMKAEKMQGSIVLFSTMQAVALFPGSTAYGGA